MDIDGFIAAACISGTPPWFPFESAFNSEKILSDQVYRSDATPLEEVAVYLVVLLGSTRLRIATTLGQEVGNNGGSTLEYRLRAPGWRFLTPGRL